jgi:DNA-binding PadR family transcriptional regulator
MILFMFGFAFGGIVGVVALAFLTTNRHMRDAAVLAAIADLKGDGYGVTIRHTTERILRRRVSVAAMYDSIDRLEAMGLITTWHADATGERGWRERRYAKVVTL